MSKSMSIVDGNEAASSVAHRGEHEPWRGSRSQRLRAWQLYEGSELVHAAR